MITDSDYKKIYDEPNVTVEGFGEEEFLKTAPLIQKFIRSYMSKNTSDAEWLTKTLAENLPNESPEEISAITQEISGNVAKFDEILSAGKAARMSGLSPEEWIADNIQTAAVGLSSQDFGDRLAQLDAVIHHSNEELAKTLTTKSGSINMNPNLDGLLVETAHANSFNRAATLSNAPLEAHVLHSTGKNSVDIGIYDKTTGKLTQRYQLKYYSDAQKTIAAIKAGDYRGQRIIVPPEQLDEVRKAFPNRKIYSAIECGDIKSKPLTKSEIKNEQKKIQGGKEIPVTDWTAYDGRDLAFHLGKEIVFSAAASAAMGAGFSVAKKILSGEEIQADEVIADALKSGADEGIKTAVGAALTVAAKRGAIPALAKVSARTISNLACKAVETIKIIGDFLSGEISGEEAVKRLFWLAASSYVLELATGSLGAAGLGATMLGFVPIIFSPIGVTVAIATAVVIGVIAFGDTLLDFAGNFFEATSEILSDIWDCVTTVAEGIGEAIGSFVDWLLD